MKRTDSWALPGPGQEAWLRFAGLAGVYYGLGWLGLRYPADGGLVSPVWHAAGLGVAAVAVWGRQAVLPIFLAATALHVGAGSPLGWALLQATGAGATAWVGGWLAVRSGAVQHPATVVSVTRFTGAALVGALPAAALGLAGLAGMGALDPQGLTQAAWMVYLSQVAGIAILAPALLAWGAAGWRLPTPRLAAWGAAVAALFVAVGFAVFGVFTAPLKFLVVPPLVWIALRHGSAATAWSLLAVDAGALMGVHLDGRALEVGPPGSAILILQGFLIVLSAFCWALALLGEDRQRLSRGLEARVAHRTKILAELNTRLETEVAERRAAEAAMEEAQHIAHMGTWHWDITKPNAEWSPELFRIYGLDPATHVPSYEDYLTRVHPDDVERVKAATTAVFQHHRPYSHDERIRRPDGSWRHLHTWAHAVTDSNGTLKALVGACQDVTDRVAQETKFAGLLESAPDAMVIVDGAGKIVLVNGQAERMFGYSRTEMLGQAIEMLVPTALAGRHAAHRANYVAHPVARSMGAGLDLRARRKDGTEIPVEISLAPLETPDGMLVSSAIRDITARQQAAHALAESLERFRALSDASPIGIVHTTAAGVVDYANRAWLAITGVQDYHDAAEMRRAVHPEDQPVAAQQWRECIREGKEFAAEMRFVRPDGSVRLTSCRAVPVKGPHGDVTGFVSAVEDITERRASEEARKKEQEARAELRRVREQAEFKTNFLRTAAHELGTPLTPIRIQLSILRRTLTGDDQQKAFGILERNLERLNLLVGDLLESARLQSGRLKVSPRPMDLASAVHEVAETFQEPAIQGGIALDTRGTAELPIVADPDRITQVLYNLLSNAMKFTPAGGHVTMEAVAQDNSVRVTVHDSGQGFTAEQGARLFQPFSQVHDAMQRTRSGSGLGLYICRGIVEQHGGTISAHSDGPGKGATFTVVLPRKAVVPPGPVPAMEAEVPRSGLGFRDAR